MTRLGPVSLDRIGAAPGDALRALRLVPEILESTREMASHTTVLADVAAVLREVAGNTASLPAMRDEMSSVSEKLDVLKTMDARMASIEEAMPVLVEVQRHLAQLPETMGRLDEALERMSGLMEKLLIGLDGLNESVATLHGAVEPMGRLASRVPGQRKGERQ